MRMAWILEIRIYRESGRIGVSESTKSGVANTRFRYMVRFFPVRAPSRIWTGQRQTNQRSRRSKRQNPTASSVPELSFWISHLLPKQSGSLAADLN